jgi:hypothetical protein
MSDGELNETTLRLERLIPLPPEILFALWTEPAQLLRWWAPDGYEPSVELLTEQWVSLVNTVMDRTLIRTYISAYIAPKTSDGKPDRAAIEAVMPAVREASCWHARSCRQ